MAKSGKVAKFVFKSGYAYDLPLLPGGNVKTRVNTVTGDIIEYSVTAHSPKVKLLTIDLSEVAAIIVEDNNG